jgi:ferredoxin
MNPLRYLKNVSTLELDGQKCIGCGMCLQVCPHAVLVMANGRVHIRDRDACMECGACAMNCPSQAISVQVGVGCAAAVINSILGRTDACCCVIDDRKSDGLSGKIGQGTGRGSCC